jgi:hypothetical protein
LSLSRPAARLICRDSDQDNWVWQECLQLLQLWMQYALSSSE